MFEAVVSSENIAPETLGWLAQRAAWPGGKRYHLNGNCIELCNILLEKFPPFSGEQLELSKTAYIFNLVRYFVALNHGRSPFLFYANTIDSLQINNEQFTIEGNCSLVLTSEKNVKSSR